MSEVEITLILKLYHLEQLSVSEIERVTPFEYSLIDQIIKEELSDSKDNRVSEEEQKPLI